MSGYRVERMFDFVIWTMGGSSRGFLYHIACFCMAVKAFLDWIGN